MWFILQIKQRDSVIACIRRIKSKAEIQLLDDPDTKLFVRLCGIVDVEKNGMDKREKFLASKRKKRKISFELAPSKIAGMKFLDLCEEDRKNVPNERDFYFEM